MIRFSDQQFLLLSRGRLSPGTHERLAQLQAAEEARRELAARKRVQARPPKAPSARAGGAIGRAMGRHRRHGTER
jgi:hypothetical protein